ncbi:MAG TPA: AMP-binding protein [Terriglobales bacterium]|nr:AMP-binding protein [Dongiaceae bacterium]HVO62198.1 AMP-binding protein [Terriglobales bacterium]
MQLENFLENSASHSPEKVALIFDQRRLTYAEVETAANRLSHALIAKGLVRGDRVTIWLENSPDLVIALFAVLKAGGVFVVVNPTTKGAKIQYILNNSRSRILVTDPRRAELLRDCWSDLPYLQVVCLSGEADHGDPGSCPLQLLASSAVYADQSLPDSPPDKKAIDIDLAALIYTSGSTGRPKGVMMTHLNMVSAATSITTYLQSRASDIVLCFLPLSFDYGLYQVLMAFKVGATLLLERSFAFPHRVLQTAVRERITGLPIVPTVSAILLQMDMAQYDFSSLRYITSTAAALPTAHVSRLRTLFPNARIYSMYGLTECKRVSYLPPEQLDIRPTSVGRGMPNEEVYIVDEQGRRVGPGIVGELVVRGANVMKGYWEDPQETSIRLRPGSYPWEQVLYTGDLFKADDEGYLYFVGRKDEIIKSRGEKVSPKEVEEVIYRLDGVSEVLVVGVPDTILGQAVKAYITLRPGSTLTAANVMQHCAQELEDYMRPKFVEFRDHLPTTPTGKLSRREVVTR